MANASWNRRCSHHVPRTVENGQRNFITTLVTSNTEFERTAQSLREGIEIPDKSRGFGDAFAAMCSGLQHCFLFLDEGLDRSMCRAAPAGYSGADD